MALNAFFTDGSHFEWFVSCQWDHKFKSPLIENERGQLAEPRCYTLTASGEELKYVEDNFENLPKALGKREVTYRDEIAQFIWDNFNPLFRKM